MRSMPDAVHNVLRQWYDGGFDGRPWQDMLLVTQQMDKRSALDHNLAIKQVILEALDTLERQAGSDLAQILRLRFLDDMTARAVANRLNISENVVYKHQRAAIRDLADIVWQTELAARSERANRIARRLDIQRPPQLFGVTDVLSDLETSLCAQGSPWIVAIGGIGGIGKTSLADALVRKLSNLPSFVDIAWVSAQQGCFTLWNGLQQDVPDRPALTYEGLTDAIIEQFGFQDLQGLTPQAKQAGLETRFRTQHYLVVIDNLETAADHRALVPSLGALVNPGKCLLTCRRHLQDYSGVRTVLLDELSAKDSLALLRHEASERGLADVADVADSSLMRIYQVTGGNPLALKLLVGQMHTFSISQIVEDLSQARGQPIQDLYHHIYWRAWQLLTQDARQVLVAMSLVAQSGGGLEQLAALSGLPSERLTAALRQLVTLSLVNVWGTIDERRYSIHHLTETFLLNEVVKWQAHS